MTARRGQRACPAHHSHSASCLRHRNLQLGVNTAPTDEPSRLPACLQTHLQWLAFLDLQLHTCYRLAHCRLDCGCQQPCCVLKGFRRTSLNHSQDSPSLVLQASCQRTPRLRQPSTVLPSSVSPFAIGTSTSCSACCNLHVFSVSGTHLATSPCQTRSCLSV